MIDLCSIRKIQSAIRQFEDALKEETGLSLNDAMCLCAIERGIGEPGQLAIRLELSPSRLTRVLDGLDSRKLITRRISDSDRRGIAVNLTKQGEKIIEKYKCADIELPDALAFTQD